MATPGGEISITVKDLSNASAIFPTNFADTVASLKVRVWEAMLLHTDASMFHLIFLGNKVPVCNAGSGVDATLADLFPGSQRPPTCTMHVVLRLGGHKGVMPDVNCEGGTQGTCDDT